MVGSSLGHWAALVVLVPFAPLLPLRGIAAAILVLADDPRRTDAALDLWQQQPKQTLDPGQRLTAAGFAAPNPAPCS